MSWYLVYCEKVVKNIAEKGRKILWEWKMLLNFATANGKWQQPLPLQEKIETASLAQLARARDL